MKRLFSLLAVAALVLVACGGGTSEVAATIDGTTEVTVGEIESYIDSGDNSVISKDVFAQFLDFQIQLLIMQQAASDQFDIVVSDEEAAAQAQVFFEQNAQPGDTIENFLATNGVTAGFFNEFARLTVLQGAIADELETTLERPAQEDIDTQMEASITALTEVCARHILVETQAEAEDVLTRLDGGETFEDLAGQLSTDPGSGANGGDLGCSSPSRYVEPFADATLSADIDVVTEPVESDFGFHLILVYDRTEPTGDDLPTEEEIIETINAGAVGQLANDWYLEAVADADIVVNERYGTWQTEPVPGVVPASE